MSTEQIYEIPLKDIEIDKENVRHADTNGELEELADSIKKHGQLQPVVLRGKYGNPPYKVIIGQRRFLAHRRIPKKTIKATFSETLTNVQAAIRSLAENMCRVELSYADAANAITALYKEFGRNDRKVAKETGLSLQRVRQYIYIEERASSQTKSALRRGKVKPVDVQRALKAASDDIGKADELLEIMKKYDKYQKSRMVEYGETHPKASVEEIDKHAQKPVVERTFVVRLSDRARKALIGAAETLHMSPDEVASRAVEEWLCSKGFAE